MKARLFCKTGKLAGASFEIRDSALIGRGTGNDVVLGHESISGKHARVFFDADRKKYVIEDLESLNGTEVDGLPISEPEVLDHLHVVTFAEDHDFIFHVPNMELREGRRESTEVELDVPVLPELEAEKDFESKREATQVDREMVVLPQELVDRAAAADSGDADHHRTEKTRIESDFPLPQRILQMSAVAGDDAESDADVETPVEHSSEARPREDESGADEAADSVASRGVGGSSAQLPIHTAETVDFDEEMVDTLQEITIPEFESRSPFSALADQERWFLEVESVEGRRRRFELCEGENLLGRGAEMQLQLETPELSRRHAALILEDGRVVVRDEGSQNGTFVNGERLEGEREIVPGTRLRFATIAATVTVQGHHLEPEG